MGKRGPKAPFFVRKLFAESVSCHGIIQKVSHEQQKQTRRPAQIGSGQEARTRQGSNPAPVTSREGNTQEAQSQRSSHSCGLSAKSRFTIRAPGTARHSFASTRNARPCSYSVPVLIEKTYSAQTQRDGHKARGKGREIYRFFRARGQRHAIEGSGYSAAYARSLRAERSGRGCAVWRQSGDHRRPAAAQGCGLGARCGPGTIAHSHHAIRLKRIPRQWPQAARVNFYSQFGSLQRREVIRLRNFLPSTSSSCPRLSVLPRDARPATLYRQEKCCSLPRSKERVRYPANPHELVALRSAKCWSQKI